MEKQQTAFAKLQETFKRMREMEPTKLERGIVSALHDCHRRLIEEPWFNRTIHDVVSYYNNQGKRNDKDLPGDDLKPSPDKVPSNDYNPDAFYGRNQSRDGERQQDQQRERNRGMER